MAAAAALAVAAAVGPGCSACRRADIEVFRPSAGARARDGVFSAPDRPAGDGAPGSRVTLSGSGRTSRATLGLVASALDLVGAHGRARSVVDGLAHFEGDGEGLRVAVRLERAGERVGETWLLDRAWALRRMGCGAMLVWEGDLAPVLERLSLVLPARAGP